MRKRERMLYRALTIGLDAEALAAFLHANNDVLDDRIGRFGAGIIRRDHRKVCRERGFAP